MIFPIGHEHMAAQRVPYVTLTIIALNVVFFIGSLMSASKHGQMLNDQYTEIQEYFMAHPYLEFPEESLEKLPQEFQDDVKEWQTLANESPESGNYGRTDMTVYALDVMREQGESQLSNEDLAALREQEQRHFNALLESFNWTYKRYPMFRYGHIPSRGGFLTIITSMFMHAGWLHLLSNMWFLWLSGCNIEDVWGRIVYPVFYLLGGMVAVAAHALMFPNSTAPLVGASGAIAAVMGAFLVRMYKTKINFIYWIGLSRGRFGAPAYIMLPLWLLQQLWEASLTGESASVAFWAHIGGFAFGAVVAAGIQVSGIEKKYLQPAIDRKVAVVDEALANGITKLHEGDVDGAIQDLREAAQSDPGNPMIFAELSRAYLRKGDTRLGIRDLKRAVNGYMKRGDMDTAIISYLEVSAEHPDVMLDTPQQLKLAAALKNRADADWQPPRMYDEDEEGPPPEPPDLYTHAAFAYKQVIQQCQRLKKLNQPQGLAALIGYADICADHLSRPKDALQAYQFALQADQLEAEQQDALHRKIQACKAAITHQAQTGQDADARKHAAAQVRERLARQRRQMAATTPPLPSLAGDDAPPAASSKPNIPLRQRLKVAQPSHDPAKYMVRSTAPHRCGKVAPVPGGLDVRILQEPPLFFETIYFLCVSQVPDPQFPSGIIVDIFIAGKDRPYRISSEQVHYQRFLKQPPMAALERFRQFLLYLVSQVESVYVDQETLTFLEQSKVRKVSEAKSLELYEKHIWQQLIGSARVQCGACWKVYWIDGARIPAGGARTTCAQCGAPMHVRPVVSVSS